MIVTKMKETAEAYWAKDTEAKSGWNVLRVLNKPTATAIARRLDKKGNDERKVLIYDMDGGTFDEVLLTIEDESCEVKSQSK